MIEQKDMTAVVIGTTENKDDSLKAEYEDFCKKDFQLKISGKELAMLIILAGNVGGTPNASLRSSDSFYYANKDLLSEDLYEKLAGSVKADIDCKQIKF